MMAAVDICTVQELMGHKSISMTVRYSHLAPKRPASSSQGNKSYRQLLGFLVSQFSGGLWA
jgi:hypothetical protein